MSKRAHGSVTASEALAGKRAEKSSHTPSNLWKMPGVSAKEEAECHRLPVTRFLC
jgi:hypothetical protein